MKRNYVRHGLFLVLVLVFLIALSVPAAASNSTRISGNGYETGTIALNGVNYACRANLGYDNEKGAYSAFTTQALVVRQHTNVTLKYMTSNLGQQKIEGGQNGPFMVTGTSRSIDTGFNGQSNPTGYISVKGDIYVTAVQSDGSSIGYLFNLSMV